MKIRAFGIASTLACLLALAPSSRAEVILDPTGVSTTMGTGFGSLGAVINKTGLSASYTNLVTDFASYTASTTHNSGATSNDWFSAFGTTTGNVDFNLGGAYAIDSFVLWTIAAGNPNNISNFTLLASDDSSFTSTTLGVTRS